MINLSEKTNSQPLSEEVVMPRRFSPHDPGHFVPLRRREESVNEDVERAKLDLHGIHDDAPAPETSAHAAWCDEEEDRCSPRPPYQGRRMAQERPSTDEPPADCTGSDNPSEGSLNCDDDATLNKKPSGRVSRSKSECHDEEKDPLW